MVSHLNQLVTFYVIFPGLLFLGIYLSFRLRFLQIRKFFTGFAHLFSRDNSGKGDLSHAQSVASVLAGNFGTGNIAGMAVALTAGGTGALVWMWIMAFFGSIIQYASCLLAVKYREQNSRGEYVGGPMYYLTRGLGLRPVAILFALAVLFGAVGVGIFAQINSIMLIVKPLGISSTLAIVIFVLASGAVILGGAKRIAQASSAIIPVMALLYLGSSLYILAMHITELPFVFVNLLRAALSPSAIIGGTFGYSFLQIVTTGLGRALFATDVGTGYVPILQAGSRTRHAVIDGMVALVAPFLVMIVCTLTGLVLMVTGATEAGFKSTQMVLFAFQQGVGSTLGHIIVGLALVLFGYTTLLAWACCFERAIGFLFGGRFRRFFQFLFLALIPIGSMLHVDLVWVFADTALTCMTLCNLVGVFGLSQEVITDSREYLKTV